MGCRVLQLGTDPLLNVARSVSEVPADPEAGRPEASVAPAIHRLHRHVQVAGEVVGAEQFIESFHLRIVARVGVDEITDSCQALLANGLRRSRHRRCRLSVIDPIAICQLSVTHLSLICNPSLV